jgi:hypothetical protein
MPPPPPPLVAELMTYAAIHNILGWLLSFICYGTNFKDQLVVANLV